MLDNFFNGFVYNYLSVKIEHLNALIAIVLTERIFVYNE